MSDDLSARMAPLAERFIERAARDRTALAAAQSRLVHSPEFARQEIAEIAHRLAGTAGLFGFAEIGLLASRLDQEAHRQDVDGKLMAGLCGELITRLAGMAVRRG